jgi:hypothetical protein
MLEAFAGPHTSMAYVEVGRRSILYTVSSLSRESLDLLLRRGLRRLNCPFESCVGVPRESAMQVEPKVANMLRRGNRTVIEEDWSAGPTTEREGHVGTLGFIHLDTPSPTPATVKNKYVSHFVCKSYFKHTAMYGSTGTISRCSITEIMSPLNVSVFIFRLW